MSLEYNVFFSCGRLIPFFQSRKRLEMIIDRIAFRSLVVMVASRHFGTLRNTATPRKLDSPGNSASPLVSTNLDVSEVVLPLVFAELILCYPDLPHLVSPGGGGRFERLSSPRKFGLFCICIGACLEQVSECPRSWTDFLISFIISFIKPAKLACISRLGWIHTGGGGVSRNVGSNKRNTRIPMTAFSADSDNRAPRDTPAAPGRPPGAHCLPPLPERRSGRCFINP